MSKEVKKSTPIGPEAFRQILKIKDPMEALDRCQALIKEARKDQWARVWASLGVIAQLNLRFTKSERAWRALTRKKFWQKCEGERPTMAERSDGMRFVVRYAERARKRKAAQNSCKHAAVIKYLLDQGVKPADIPAKLAKRGQGINATYAKSTQNGSSVDASKDNGHTKPSDAVDTGVATKAQLEDVGQGGGNRSVPGKGGLTVARNEQPSSEPQNGKAPSLVLLKLKGKAEEVTRVDALDLGDEVYLRVRVRKTKSGKRLLKLLEVRRDLPKFARGSERRKKDPRRLNATSQQQSRNQGKDHSQKSW